MMELKRDRLRDSMVALGISVDWSDWKDTQALGDRIRREVM